MYPTVRYHATEAPAGRKFTDEAEFNALGPEWVDTPTKFGQTIDAHDDLGTARPPTAKPPVVSPPTRRGRKHRTESKR